MDERSQGVSAAIHVTDRVVDRRFVRVAQLTAERVGVEFLGQAANEVVKAAISALMAVTGHVGIVINRVNLAKHARYGYGDHSDYYSRYQGYYGDEAEETAKPSRRPSLKLAK